MSIARIYTSRFAARKGATLKCGKCGRSIEKGETYRWYKIGFRSRYKYIRCDSMACTPRYSELESRDNMVTVWSAIESANDTLDGLDAADPEENTNSIDEAVQTAGQEINEAAGAYREAAEAMGGAGYEMEEKADTLEEAGGELEGYESEETDPPDNHEDDEHEGEQDDCGQCADDRQEWWSEQIQNARDAIDSAQVD